MNSHKAESMVPNAKDNIVKAGGNGAIFIRLASSITTALLDLDPTDNSVKNIAVTDIADIATINCLPFSVNVEDAARDVVFPWVRCNDRAWAKNRDRST